MAGRPYTFFQLGQRYLNYYFTALNSRGHGIHSPFVYAFVREILLDKTGFPLFSAIEQERSLLRRSTRRVEIMDYGAGSGKTTANQRTVGQITRSATKPPRLAQLLFRVARYFKVNTVIELGSSVGLTTAYLAGAVPQARVYSLEGDPVLAEIARDTISHLALENATVITGNFDDNFQSLLNRVGIVDLVYIDGNHRLEPTLRYFELALKNSHQETVLIFDDIHWSEEMESAWQTIRSHPKVTATIDLFFLGFVFLRPDFKEVQHFKIRY